MPGTVNDFLSRFGGGGAMDNRDRDVSQYYDRFASTHPDDRDFDNDAMCDGASQYLGQMPDDEFEQAAANAYTRTPPEQRQGLLSSLLGGLQNRRVNIDSIGVGSRNLDAMGPSDYARVASYARRNHPELIRDQVREQPGLLKAMGNPIVMGALGMVAGHLMRKRRP